MFLSNIFILIIFISRFLPYTLSYLTNKIYELFV